MQDQRNHIRIKGVLFSLVILLLAAPMVQQNTGLIKTNRIWGSYDDAVKPELNKNSWFSGSYQEQIQKYIDQNIGFQSFMIRLYNQLYYSVFNQARANGVLIGKENFLYEKVYIDALLGTDFIGEEKIGQRVERIELLSDSLKKKGIPLLVVLAPGKGTFFPDHIPGKYQAKNKSTTNYEVFKKELDNSDVLHLDFQEWFLNMKDDAAHPLFPKNGIHWSQYGEYLALDSLLAFLQGQHNGYTPGIDLKNIETDKKARGRDTDIELAMNLLYKNSDFEMAYPQYNFTQSSPDDSIRILTVADSYFNYLFKEVMNKNKAFNGSQFWYYNQQVFSGKSNGETYVKDLNITREVLKSDIVILLSTDANLYRFPFGFEDQLYYDMFIKNKRLNQFVAAINNSEELRSKINKYASKKNAEVSEALLDIAAGLHKYERDFIRKNKIYDYENKIRNDNNWLESIKKKAASNNISIDEAIKADAIYMVDVEIKKAIDNETDYLCFEPDRDLLVKNPKYLDQLLDYYLNVNAYMEKIYSTPEWIESVQKKARQNNISIEKAVQLDAEYMVQEDYKKDGTQSFFN